MPEEKELPKWMKRRIEEFKHGKGVPLPPTEGLKGRDLQPLDPRRVREDLRAKRSLELVRELKLDERLVEHAELRGEGGQLHDALFMLKGMEEMGMDVSELKRGLVKNKVADAHMKILVFANENAPRVVQKLEGQL